MIEQEIFDRVVRHLLTQKRKSVDVHALCLYRNHTGLSCAVGCLIDAAHYKPEIERQAVNTAVVQDALVLSGVLTRSACPGVFRGPDEGKVDLRCKLQRVHDTYEVAEWPRQLKVVGRGRGLNLDVLEDFKYVALS